MLTVRVILRANTDRIAIVSAAAALGVLAGCALFYVTLSLSDGDSRLATF